MLNKLTLRDRIFAISSLLILVAIALIWVFIKPQYQQTVVKERTTIVSQLQEYTLRQTDNTIRNWLNATLRLSQDLTLDPAKAPEISNKAINYTPGLMRVLISDTQSDEEIDLVRGIHNSVDFSIEDINWYPSKLDGTMNTAWISDPDQNVDFFISEKAFQIGENVFRLRMYFNSQSLNDNLINIPLNKDSYFANIQDGLSNNMIVAQDFNFPTDLIGETSFSEEKVIQVDNKDWYILSSKFETIPFWHLIAVKDAYILEPVNQLLLFSYYTAGSVLLLMFAFSWYVSLRINKPIKLLLSDVEHLENLDFDHRIKQVSLPEFQPMHDTLENIRATLSRYQKINVEKIILEEWKNKYMVTYSEDLIGIIGEEGTFNFINNQFTSFLESLQLNPKNTSLEKILKHPSIKVSESNQSLHYPDPFTIKVTQSELTHSTEEGTDYYYDFQYVSIMDDKNNETGAYVIIHDKTEDRLLDIKRNDMINVIVHELKNPITGVVGLSRLIIESDSMSADESKTLMQEVLNSGERMNELVNRFLDVQKLEAGNTSLNVTDVDIKQTIQEVSALSKPLMSTKNLKLSFSEIGLGFTLQGDNDLVFDAIQNILSNAIKYGDPERVIDIGLKATKKNVSVAITDHGYGISIEDQGKVFDKFFRVKSNTKAAKEKGTGLGLAYVKEIMQRHNGDIALESSSKIGTRFILTFPKKYSEVKMKRLLPLLLLLNFPFEVFAQQPITFTSDKLQEISQVYAGNTLNWPVVVSLAEHDITGNTFTLSASSLLRLRNLSNTSYVFQDQQKRINLLISEGAAIFAANNLKNTNQLFRDYLTEIRAGNLEKALEIGASLKPSVDAIERTLTRNRLVTVQAQLSAKDGFVDKRLGLLSGWEEAYVGDLFEESHGVKTKKESYATLTFTDGSNIIVNPSTTAIIRKSRIDKLDKSADAEITLVQGGLLSKLSAAGKERSKYILNAGSSTTELNSVNFYAENSNDNDVKLSNYDGDAQVSSNNVIVTIRKDEGTIIRGNQAPLPPVKLLKAPKFYSSKPDTILYQQGFLLNFKRVDNAVKYRVEYSTSYNFDENVIVKEITGTSLMIDDLELGTTYLKVQSIDELGLKGPFSEPYRVIRNEDTKAPPIFGEQFERPIYFTKSNSITVTGVTEPDAVVSVNGNLVEVSKSGTFTTTLSLSSNEQIIPVTATDGSQNFTRKELRIARLTEEYLFDIKMNGVEIENEISILNPAKTITGKAYPEMEIELINGDKIKTVKTDSQGRWGVTMNVQQGKLSITFKANQKSTETLTKSYTVK